MTGDQVVQACGQPQKVDKSKQKATTKVPITLMTFNVATSTTSLGSGVYQRGLQSSQVVLNTGPLTPVTVTSKDNKIVGISMSGQSVQSLSICGYAFAVGDSPDSAVSSCGQPNSVNNTYQLVDTDQTQLIETWSYQPGNYQRPFQLIFTDGVLSQINS